MDGKYIADRITALRMKKGVSEYKMSMDVGHNKSYVQSISSGRSLPSMSEFLYLCEYLGVTPKEFFDPDLECPTLLHELTELAQKMDEDDLKCLIAVAKRIVK